jgi:hypothetical protein
MGKRSSRVKSNFIPLLRVGATEGSDGVSDGLIVRVCIRRSDRRERVMVGATEGSDGIKDCVENLL